MDGIAISSVVPPLDSTLRQVCELYFKVKPMFVEPGIKTGIPVLTDNPAELGADRIVNCVAAFERFGGPCIVVDMGTATTFDVLSKKGSFSAARLLPALVSQQMRCSRERRGFPAWISRNPRRSSEQGRSTTSRSASITATSAW